MSEVELLIKGLETNNSGNIIANAQNLRTVGIIQQKLQSIISSPEYRRSVKDYLGNFNDVAKLNDKYYSALSDNYTRPPIVAELQKQTIDATINSLTAAGISQSVTSKVQDILRVNITTGASYADLSQQLRDFLTQNKTGEGALERYTKQITTDALNQYSAQYSKAVSDDLGFEWFRYTGAEIEDSRPFCKAMIDKKYFHKSEIPKLLEGKFPEFADNKGVIYDKTGLPAGMVAGTSPETFFTYRGGYNCGHQIVGVPTDSVPPEYRKALLFGKLDEPIGIKTKPAKAPAPTNLPPDAQKALELLKNFKPAKTIKEATKFANDAKLAKTPIDYKLAKGAAALQYVNELNAALLKLKSEGLEVYDKVFLSNSPTKTFRAQNWTRYLSNGDIQMSLQLNIGKDLSLANYKRVADSGWSISRSINDTINHEYGHFLTKPPTRAEYDRIDPILMKIKIPVSEYGATQGWEALAEIYALYKREGVAPLEQDWIDFFNKYSAKIKIPNK
jgi:hypothetical protein